MRKILGSLAVVAAASFSTNALAQSDNAWTDCGIGGIIADAAFDKGSSEARITALILNITWDFGTTALTSHTASPDTCANRAGAVAAFVGENYETLAKQTAQGEGDHLTALLGFAGCQETQMAASTSMLRNEIAGQISNSDYSQWSQNQKAEAYYQAVMNTSAQCNS